MLTLTRAFIRAEYEAIDEATLRGVAERAFDSAEVTGSEFFADLEHGAEVIVRRGSIEVIAIVTSTASAVLTFIANYGTIADGAEKLAVHVKKAGEFLKSQLRHSAPGRVITARSTASDLTRLNSIILQIQHGLLSRREGADRAKAIFARAGEEVTPEMEANLEIILMELPEIRPEERIRPPDLLQPSRTGASALLGKQPKPSIPQGVEISREPGAIQIKRRTF